MGSPLPLSAPVASGQQAIGENVVGLLAKEKGKMQIAKHIHLMAGLRFAFKAVAFKTQTGTLVGTKKEQ